MAIVSSNSLFHFTGTQKAFFGILQKGFRHSYCFEEYKKEIAKFIIRPEIELMRIKGSSETQYGIAVPMICFCDIPLLQTSIHRKKYGNYCIGLDKEMAIKRLPSMNPVQYVSSDWIIQMLETLVKCTPRKDELSQYQSQVKQITKGLDVFQGAAEIIKAKQKGELATINDKLIYPVGLLLSLIKTDISCYDEREWRVFFSEAGSTQYNLTKKQFEENKKEYKEMLKSSYVTLDSSIIKHIIVPQDSMIPKIIKKLLGLKTILGRSVSEEEKLVLISKISSFERIDGDF